MSFVMNGIFTNMLEEQRQSKEENIERSIFMQLSEMDSAHAYFMELENKEMEADLYELRAYYERNPNIYSWDMTQIKQEIGNREFFIIDKESEIVVTTQRKSENFDFKDCCSDFVALVNRRIVTDQFYFDGLENSVALKETWLYSYLPTADHQYLLEFGIRFGDTSVSKHFSYEETVDNLLENNTNLVDLRILTRGGFVLNDTASFSKIEDMPADIERAFNSAVEHDNVTEVKKLNNDGLIETHRFIPYEAEIERGNATQRMIYVKYDNADEVDLKNKQTTMLLYMLAIGIVTAIVIMFIILRLFNRTIRLATYDALTGAYNRASYLQLTEELLHQSKKSPIGLMLLDLDNFKQANDQYGHIEGDKILKEFTTLLKAIVGKQGTVVRLGGDEFAIIFEKAEAQQLQDVAQQILMTARSQHKYNNVWSILSVSIGSTIQLHSHESEAQLFERADQALYNSKQNGKNKDTLF